MCCALGPGKPPDGPDGAVVHGALKHVIQEEPAPKEAGATRLHPGPTGAGVAASCSCAGATHASLSSRSIQLFPTPWTIDV